MAHGPQVAVRLDCPVLDELDRLVEEGQFASWADAVRHALEALLDACRRAAIGAQIAEGYRRQPQSDAEEKAALANLRELVAEEPW